MEAAIKIYFLLVIVVAHGLREVSCQGGYPQRDIKKLVNLESTQKGVAKDGRTSLRGKIYLAMLKRLSTTAWYERYSPWMGYEPYWVGGDWILDIVSTSMGPAWYFNPILMSYLIDYRYYQTTAMYVCGKPCGASFRAVGSVCAINMGIYWYLWYESYHPGAKKNEYPYRTFISYCDFLAFNCRLDATSKYGLVHFGACLEDKQVYLQTYHRYDIAADRNAQSSRIGFYFNDLYSRWAYLGITDTPFHLTEAYSPTVTESMVVKVLNVFDPAKFVPWLHLG